MKLQQLIYALYSLLIEYLQFVHYSFAHGQMNDSRSDVMSDKRTLEDGASKCVNLRQKVNKYVRNVALDTWQNVMSNKNSTAYVYSAFTDPRYTNCTMIRIIGLAHKFLRHENLECQIYLPDSDDAFVFPLRIEAFPAMQKM